MTVWLILLAMYVPAMIYGAILLGRLCLDRACIAFLDKSKHNSIVKGDH